MASEKIILSISVLISNRPETVGKCLDSLGSLRSKVPSELILVDTGCGDYVRRMIGHYANKIIDFEWCNDFSKARNAGLKQARGEWFLYLDDDEWFEDTEEIEDFFLSDKHLRYNYASYYVRNYLDREGKKYEDVCVDRMVRLFSGVEFIYSIHETFSQIIPPVIRLHSFVHHYGYVFKDEEEMKKHCQRNIELLLSEHEKNPGDLRHNAQLAQEYNGLREWEKSIEISLVGIRNAGQGAANESFLGGLYANVARNCVMLEQYSAAIEMGKAYLQLESSDVIAEASVYYNLCIAFLEQGEYGNSLEAVDSYKVCYEKWKKDRDSYAVYENIVADVFAMEYVRNAVCIGIQDSMKLGNSTCAKKYFDEINWDSPGMISDSRLQQMIRLLVEIWLQTDANKAQDYTGMLEILLDSRVLARIVISEVEAIRLSNPNLLRAENVDWAVLAKKSWIFLYYKLKNMENMDHNVAGEDYVSLWKEPETALLRANELGLWEMAREYAVPMQQILSAVPVYHWKQAAEMAVKKLDWVEVQKLQVLLQAVLEADSLHMLFWNIPYRMRRIQMMSEKADEEENSAALIQEKIIQDLLEYAAENEMLYRCLYREEIFGERPELLPQGCQLSLKLSHMADEVEAGHLSKALVDVKEALEIMPELSRALKYCTQWISERAKAEERERSRAADELHRLAETVKGQVRSMVAQGMYAEVAGILQQLKTLLPQDRELEGLEREIFGKT